MDVNVSHQIAELRTFSRQQLEDLWEKLYKRPVPGETRRELLIPFLAYRIQENAYGGLKPKTRSELRRIARGFEKSPSTKLKPKTRIKPGTRLYREWHGKTYEVFVTESGFEYHGGSYRSLSEIARKITGTPWSGPAFFGLKTIKPTGGDSSD